MCYRDLLVVSFFFFNDTATTEIYTLSLHDALPICRPRLLPWPHRASLDVSSRYIGARDDEGGDVLEFAILGLLQDRKSTRLNSSHANISYAVFCLKKKKK